MKQPLKEYRCDTCWRWMSIEEAWLEYLKKKNSSEVSEFRICCNRLSCMKHTPTPEGFTCFDNHLTNVAKDHAIYTLFHALDHYEIKDMANFTEVYKRLIVPYYEEARLYFGKVGGDYHYYHFHMPETLKHIVSFYSEDDESG